MNQRFFQLVAFVFAGSFAATRSVAQTLIPALSFTHPVLQTGSGARPAGADGAVYIFQNVGFGIDARVTIAGRSAAAVTLVDPDLEGPESNAHGVGSDDAWQPLVAYADGHAPAHEAWWMEFRIEFVRHDDHALPVTANRFVVTGLDIDGDGGQLREFQTFFKARDYSLEANSGILASFTTGETTDSRSPGRRFTGPSADYPGISLDAPATTVADVYRKTSAITVRLGAETGRIASTAATREYGLLFRNFAFGVPDKKDSPASAAGLMAFATRE